MPISGDSCGVVERGVGVLPGGKPWLQHRIAEWRPRHYVRGKKAETVVPIPITCVVEGGWAVEEEFDYDGWVDYHEEDDFVP